MTDSLLISIKEACKLLSISRSKLYDLHEKNSTFPSFIKLGRKSLISRSKLEQWVKSISDNSKQ